MVHNGNENSSKIKYHLMKYLEIFRKRSIKNKCSFNIKNILKLITNCFNRYRNIILIVYFAII